MEVQVQQAPGMAVRTVTVTLDATQVASKRFLGGYRDKRSGTVYHHADCQTEHRKVGPALRPALGRASLFPPGCTTMQFAGSAGSWVSAMATCQGQICLASSLSWHLRRGCQRLGNKLCSGSRRAEVPFEHLHP